MPDKRELKRHRKRLTLKFGIESPERIAFTEDISSDGLFIKTVSICPVGSRIRISLMMPDNREVSMVGRVMWAKKVPPQMIHRVNKSGMGVRIERFLSGNDIYAEMCNELSAR